MAIITTSALISDIKGRLNGSVFQRTQGGLAVRSQPGVINRDTTKQNFGKLGAAFIQSAWQSLTTAQRALWNTYAIFRPRPSRKNALVFLRGQQVFFLEQNIRYNMHGFGTEFDTIINPAPVLSILPNILQMDEITSSGAAVRIRTVQPVIVADESVICYLSRPLLSSQVSGYNKTALLRFTTADGSVQDVTTPYVEAYGRVPQVGEYLLYDLSRYTVADKTQSASSKGIIIVTTP